MSCICPFCRYKNTFLLINQNENENENCCEICYEDNNTITYCCNKNICYKCVLHTYIKYPIPINIKHFCKKNLIIDNKIYENKNLVCIRCGREGNINILCCNIQYCYECINNYYMINHTYELKIELNDILIQKRIEKNNIIKDIINISNNLSNNNYFNITTKDLIFSKLDLLENRNLVYYQNKLIKNLDNNQNNINIKLDILILSENDKLLINNINNNINHEKNIELYNLSNVLKNDSFIIIKLMKNYGYIYKSCSTYIKSNKKIILFAIKYDYNLFEYIPDNIKDDQFMILELLIINIKIIEFLKITDILIKLIINNIEKFVEDDLIKILNYNKINNNKDLVSKILSINGLFLKYITNDLLNDKSILLIAINNNGLSYEYIPEEYKYDSNIYNIALKKDIKSFKFLPKKIKSIEEIIYFAIKNGVDIQYINNKYLYNREYLIEGIKKNFKNIKYVPLRFQYDIEFNQEIIEYNKEIIKYINNEKILIRLLEINNELYNYISPIFKGNNNFIEKLLDKIPYLIKYVPTKFKTNKNLVLKILQKNGLLLEFINNKLIRDDDIIITAINQNINAKKFICSKLINKYDY